MGGDTSDGASFVAQSQRSSGRPDYSADSAVETEGGITDRAQGGDRTDDQKPKGKEPDPLQRAPRAPKSTGFPPTKEKKKVEKGPKPQKTEKTTEKKKKT